MGPFPKQEHVEVKIDTVIPALKPKEERLQEPSKDEYARKMTALDAEIDKLRDQIKKINDEK